MLANANKSKHTRLQSRSGPTTDTSSAIVTDACVLKQTSDHIFPITRHITCYIFVIGSEKTCYVVR